MKLSAAKRPMSQIAKSQFRLAVQPRLRILPISKPIAIIVPRAGGNYAAQKKVHHIEPVSSVASAASVMTVRRTLTPFGRDA